MKLSKQELEAVIAASPRSFVPFNKLVLSPTYQARPENPAAPLPLAELAASIDAAGLLHNLIVVRGARGLRIACTAGTVWITVADEPGDTFLSAGQTHVVQGNGLAIVENIGSGSIRIGKSGNTPVWRTWLATLRRLFAGGQQAMARHATVLHP